MTTTHDAELVFSHLSGPLRGKANGPACNALQRVVDSHAELVAILETLTREASIDDDSRWRILHVSHLDKAAKILAKAKGTTTTTTTTDTEN